MTDAQKLARILAILRAAVASGDARARVLAEVEEVARGWHGAARRGPESRER